MPPNIKISLRSGWWAGASPSALQFVGPRDEAMQILLPHLSRWTVGAACESRLSSAGSSSGPEGWPVVGRQRSTRQNGCDILAPLKVFEHLPIGAVEREMVPLGG